MTLGQLLDWVDIARPSAYTREQKTAWVSDLEAVLWTQIFLQPMSLWRPYDPEEDGGARLLLPGGWRRVYTAYLGAMIDFANGEYSQYENSMSLYNGCICELGAWYAAAFEPAQNAAQWVRLGAYACSDLADGGRAAGALGPDAAALCVRYRVDEPAGGTLTLSVGETGRLSDGVYITKETESLCRTPGLALSSGAREKLILRYEGDTDGDRSVEAWLLVQPAAKINMFT